MRAVAGRTVTHLYLGVYSSETVAVARSVNPKRITVLDDGTSTLRISEQRFCDIRTGKESPYPRWKTALKRLSGVDPRHLRNLRFFTLVQPTLAMGDEYVACNLDFLSGQMKDRPRANEVWILGTNLVDLGHIDGETYAQIIRCALDRELSYDDSTRVRYHPHPRESALRVAELVAQLGMELVRNSDPVELRFVNSKSIPGGGIVSFPSSALVSLAKLLPDDVPISMISMAGLTTSATIEGIERGVI